MKRIFLMLACLAGCGGRPAVTELSQEATTTDPKLAACDLQLSDGKMKAMCGTLVAPELRGDTGSAMLRIPFQRTTSGTGTPVFYVGDGPGSSSYQFRPPSALLAGRDLVIVGTRGIDGGRSLDCPEVGEALKQPTDAWGEIVPAAFINCMERLAGDGVRLAGYGITEKVADLEKVRSLTKIERFDFVADGFGAITALAYARFHPEHVNRIVLLGPTPADQPVGSSQDSARVLRAYDAGIDSVVRELELPGRWLMYKIDRDRVRLATALQLGYRRGATASVGAWRDAANGDFAGVGQMSWGADVVLGSSYVWGEVLPTLASLGRVGYIVDVDPVLPSATVVTALGGFGLVSLALPEFPPLPTMPVAHPTLVIHGDLDPRFSPETTVAAMQRELTQVSFTRIAGYGVVSELWAVAPELLSQTIVGFLEGKVVAADLAPPLSPEGPSLATMAKMVVAAMAVFPFIGIGIVYLLYRRFRATVLRDAARRPGAEAPANPG